MSKASISWEYVVVPMLVGIFLIGIIVAVLSYGIGQNKEDDSKRQCAINFRTYCVEKYQLKIGGEWTGEGEQSCVPAAQACQKCKDILGDNVVTC